MAKINRRNFIGAIAALGVAVPAVAIGPSTAILDRGLLKAKSILLPSMWEMMNKTGLEGEITIEEKAIFVLAWHPSDREDKWGFVITAPQISDDRYKDIFLSGLDDLCNHVLYRYPNA